MIRVGTVRATTGALALALLLSACVSPALGADSYRGKAANALDEALSQVQTAVLTMDAFLRGRVFATFADEVVSSAEAAGGWAQESFGAVQPPREVDGVQREVSGLLAESADRLTRARIATRRTTESSWVSSSPS